MELPRNITQVGETDRNCKIYVEDYVVSYMKQMNKFAEEKEISVALYGKMSVEEQVTYCFVYGACVIQSVAREVRHLSQAQNQEIERLRRKYFPEQTFLGYQILNGEMIEGFRIYDQNSCRYVKGYACFFEKNDAMLAYMLETRREEAQPEKVEQDKYDMVRKRQEDRRLQFEDRGQARKRQAEEERAENGRNVRRAAKKEPVKENTPMEENRENYRFKVMPFVAVAGCCLLAMTAWGNEGIQESVKSHLTSFVTNLTELKLAADENTDREDVIVGVTEQEEGKEEVQAVMGTLVTEDKLAEAIRQENEKMAETIASSEAGEGNGDSGSGADASSSGATGTGAPDASSGASGTTGTTTPSGANGATGTTTPSGASGTTGATTPSGASGTTGTTTSSGVSGTTGATTTPNTSENSDVSDTGDSSTSTTGDDTANTASRETVTHPETYVIRQGDTLIAISKNVYGNDTYVSEICALNNISNPDNIQIGQKILLP